MTFRLVKYLSQVFRVVETTTILFVLAASAMCMGQSSARQTATPTFRTIISYNGVVCIATPNYDLMPNGRVIVKRDGGVRFDGSGYFWSTAIRDNIVRRGHYKGRTVGTQNQYWPPLTQTQAPKAQPNHLTIQQNLSPYFGSGKHPTNRTRERIPATHYPTPPTQKSAHLVRCPNGSYAIYCR